MFARVVTFHRRPDLLEEAVASAREEVLALMQRQAGFKGFYVLADRTSGKQIGISFWETEAAARAAAAVLDPLRDRTSRELGDTAPPTTELFEVVAHA